MTAASPLPVNRAERGRSAHAVPSSQASYLRAAVLPAAVIAVVCAAAALAALLGRAQAHVLREVLAGVALGVLAMLVVAFVAARAASRRVDAQLQASRLIAQRGQAELQQLAERIMRGEQLAPLALAPDRVADDDPFRLLAGELEQSHYQAAQGMLRVADRVLSGRSDQRVEIFVNLARRMQSLVHREIEMLDDLEAQVEDPDLLKGLFTVDHLATRLRRQSESLAVLGGSSSRRQWTRQVTMHEVLRAAVAEVEHYSRVKVVPPVEGVLRGAAVTDVIHLIAELVENATKFSAPHTTALLRAQHVSAGVAIEVDDRGLGMVPADLQRMNVLLADPGRMDVGELLRDGRIGLYVVAALARRHGIRVQLQNNIYGGTQAVVVLPKSLLDPEDHSLPATALADEDRDANPRLALVPAGGTGNSGAGRSGGAEGRPADRPAAEQAQPPLQARLPVSGASSAAVSWQPADSWQQADGWQPADSWQPAEGGPATGTRPALPRRQGHTSVTTPPRGQLADEPGGTEQPADPMTGLMADFLRGVSRAEGGDTSARD
jgi:signal transduction histidine kinase